MEEEVDSSLVPVPLELARAEVDSIMTSVDVSDNSAYWSLEQAPPPQPQRMTSLMSSSDPVSGGDSLTADPLAKEKTQFMLDDKRITSAALTSVTQGPPGQEFSWASWLVLEGSIGTSRRLMQALHLVLPSLLGIPRPISVGSTPTQDSLTHTDSLWHRYV